MQNIFIKGPSDSSEWNLWKILTLLTFSKKQYKKIFKKIFIFIYLDLLNEKS